MYADLETIGMQSIYKTLSYILVRSIGELSFLQLASEQCFEKPYNENGVEFELEDHCDT